MPKQGTAEEQLTRMIQSAKIAGSPIVRAVLGSSADRSRPAGHRGQYREYGEGAARGAQPRARQRAQDRDRKSRRRHAGARTEDADRGSGQGFRGRVSRFRQSAVDDRRSAPDAGDARALRPHQPHSRHRCVGRARRRGGGMGADGRGQHRHRRLRAQVYRAVPGPRAFARGDRGRAAAHLRVSRSEVLGAVPQDAGVGVRPVHGAGG